MTMTKLWNMITAWFASKGGASHVLALTYIFAMAAYAAVPSFHALVISVHQALPAWVQELGTTALALVAFYKTWNGTKPAGGQKSAGSLLPVIALLALLPVLSLVGCARPVTAPLPAGAINAADAGVYRILDDAHAFTVKVRFDIAAGKATLTDGQKATFNTLIGDLNTADLLWRAYHAAASATASTVQLDAAVSKVSSDLTAATAQIQAH